MRSISRRRISGARLSGCPEYALVATPLRIIATSSGSGI
jgi:hypothetical protein